VKWTSLFSWKSKAWAGLLVLSLILNLLFLSVFVGYWVGEVRQARQSLESLVSVLPVEKRDKARRELSLMWPVLRQHAQSGRVLLVELDQLLTKPQLEEAAINQHLLKMQQETTAAQSQVQQIFIRAVKDLAPAERHNLLLGLIRMLNRKNPESGN